MRFTRTQTIVLANQKGGCGKTTTAVNLAAGLALEGLRTCLVDLDSQCNATMTFGIDTEDLRRAKKPTVLDAFINKRPARQIAIEVPERFDGMLSVLPGHPSLSAVHQKLDSDLRMEALDKGLSPEDEDDQRANHRERLADSLADLHDEFDCIVVDTPPDLGFLLSSALRSGDWFIVPVFPSDYDLKGLSKLTQSARKVRERGNPGLRLMSVLVGNFDRSARLDQDIYEQLRSKFGEQMSAVKVTRGVRMRELPSFQTTIFEHDPKCDQAEQYRDFCREVIKRIERRERGVAEAVAPTVNSAQPSGSVQTEHTVGEMSNG